MAAIDSWHEPLEIAHTLIFCTSFNLISILLIFFGQLAANFFLLMLSELTHVITLLFLWEKCVKSWKISQSDLIYIVIDQFSQRLFISIIWTLFSILEFLANGSWKRPSKTVKSLKPETLSQEQKYVDPRTNSDSNDVCRWCLWSAAAYYDMWSS